MADDPNSPPQINGPQPNLQSLPNLGPTPQQQISGMPQMGQSNSATQALDTADQYWQQQLKANTPQQPSGGPVRNMLQRFFSGMGNSMMHESGLPTQYDLQQRALTGLQNNAIARGNLALHQIMAQQYGLKNQATAQALSTLSPEEAGALGHPEFAGMTHQNALTILSKLLPVEAKPVNVSGVGAFQGAAGNFAPIAGTQAQPIPVDHDTAQLAGMPQLEGQPANAATWSNINKALQAKGYTIQDMGINGTGPNQGMWLRDRAGTPIKQVSPNSLVYQRGASFAQNRAAYTPFETVEPGTNIPTTISNLQALQTGAPKIPIGTQAKLGGSYAQYNDAYGILDKIDGLVGNGPGQVNVNDPAVRARLTAGYAALKDPQVTGMIARVAGPIASEFASNFLARQPIGSQLKPEERELLLTQLQGKAAATGLRGILGQAGSNEFQQRLDAGMFPGGQSLANNDAIKQQTKATRSLLDRFQVGQPQAGLNAPNTPTNLRNKMSGDLGDAGGKPEGSTGKLPDGTKVVVRGGRIVRQ